MRDERAAQPGYLGPFIATFLGVGLACTCLHHWAKHHIEQSVKNAAQAVVHSVKNSAEQRVNQSMSAGFRVRVIADSNAPRPYSFLHELSYQQFGPKKGHALSQSEDRADAYAWIRGRSGDAVWTDLETGRLWAVGPLDSGGVVVVESPSVQYSLVVIYALLGLIGLMGWFIWGLSVRRFTSSPLAPIFGASMVALGILVVTFFSTRHVDYVVSPLRELTVVGNDDGLWGTWAYPLAIVPLLPLFIYGVSGARNRGQMSPHRVAYLYVFPAVFSLLVLVLLPFAFGVLLSFLRYSHGSFSWVGLANFTQILLNQDYAITHPLNFYFTLGFTILWTATNVFLHVSIGLALALVLHREDLKFKGLYRVLLIIPWAVPSYITALIWKGMFNKQFGLINEVLKGIGLEPVGWFSGFWTAFTANLTTNTWLGFPFMMVVALGALQSIPKDLYEAAEVDGATPRQQFRAITLPLLKPALLPAVILGTIWTFNMFNIVYLVSGGQPDGSTDILITEAYRWAFEHERYGYAAAYSFIIFGVLLTYSILTQRVGKKAKEAQA